MPLQKNLSPLSKMEPTFLLGYISERWGDTPPSEIAKKLAVELLRLPENETQCLSYGNLLNLIGHDQLSESFLSAVVILTAGKHPILEPYGIFVDDAGDEFPMRGADFTQVVKTGRLVHPISGDIIESAGRYVVPVFERTGKVNNS